MNEHWDKCLNVWNLLWEYAKTHPQIYFVELGAGSGENTRQILRSADEFNLYLTTISDGKCPEDLEKYERLVWINGVSYTQLANEEDNSIDFCSIDTDHNYFTMKKELEQLVKKMKPGGIVVFHDSETYGRQGGMMQYFNCGESYPYEEIKNTLGKGLLDAVAEFPQFEKIGENKEMCGAWALKKL